MKITEITEGWGEYSNKSNHRMNKLKRVVIHTVALGGDADVAFMQGLAEDTGGQFKHVAGK